MNKKLIAVAVAGAIAGPTVMSAAGADVSVYGALYPRISIQDGDVTMEDGASRFGFKSSKDMGNGNSVAGVMEFSVDAGNGKITSGDTSRLANISYSGDWGSATIGSGWSIDSSNKACVAGGQGCGHVGYQGRVADMIQVTGDLGGFNVSAQTEFDGTDGVAAWALATSIGFGSLDVAAFYRDDGTDTTTHIGASTTLAGVYVGVEAGDSSDGTDSWGLGVKLPGGVKIGMDNVAGDLQQVTASYDIPLGGSTLRLIVRDNEGADTYAKVQWNYSL
ncbi:MAG: hypothetical protein NZ807_10350 [Dehalococcoidia bacterium]|nr:hypothetical protein [Dehalococcoidia bacterium]